MKRILFVSDLHYPVGPPDTMRPEMRRNWERFGQRGRQFMDRFEERLRDEASRAQDVTRAWLDEHVDEYDIVIEGGDVALPLGEHVDRMNAAEQVWGEHIERTGEPELIVLTGNHELGHGFDVEAENFADLLALRERLFTTSVNRRGYGLRIENDVQLLFVDSELIALAESSEVDPFVEQHNRAQIDLLRQVCANRNPLVLFTHNTTRVVRWIRRRLGLWASFTDRVQPPILIGGHYHMPRAVVHRGAEIRWSAGGSYPEPWLRWVAGMPYTGIRQYWPGGVELQLRDGRPVARQRNFNGDHPGRF